MKKYSTLFVAVKAETSVGEVGLRRWRQPAQGWSRLHLSQFAIMHHKLLLALSEIYGHKIAKGLLGLQQIWKGLVSFPLIYLYTLFQT